MVVLVVDKMRKRRNPPMDLEVPSAFYRLLRRVARDSELTPEVCLMRAVSLFDEFVKRGRGDLKSLVDERTARSKAIREWWSKQSTEEKHARAVKAASARWGKSEQPS